MYRRAHRDCTFDSFISPYTNFKFRCEDMYNGFNGLLHGRSINNVLILLLLIQNYERSDDWRSTDIEILSYERVSRALMKLKSLKTVLDSNIFGPAWRGSEVKFTPVLRSKSNATYLDGNNSYLYRLARAGPNRLLVLEECILHCLMNDSIPTHHNIFQNVHVPLLRVLWIKDLKVILDTQRGEVQNSGSNHELGDTLLRPFE